MTTDRQKPDWHAVRRERMNAAILAATRDILKAGLFQPSIREISKRAGVSVRTIFDQFESREGLLTRALEDGVTREHIVSFVCCMGGPPANPQDQLSIVKAIVLGHL